MKIASKKRSFWVYFGLVVMILSLLLFSVLPLVTAIVKESRSQNTSSVFNDRLEQEALGYQLVIDREPDNQNALKGLLNIRLQKGDIKGVIEPLSRLSQLNPDIIDYQLLLAQTQIQVEDYTKANATYEKALTQHPDNLIILKSWTEMLLGQNEPEKAIALVKQKINQGNNSDRTALQLLLGEIYTTQGETQAAIAIYDQAIKAAQSDFRPFLAKALLLKQQETPEADNLFKQAIELAPVQYKDQIKELSVS